MVVWSNPPRATFLFDHKTPHCWSLSQIMLMLYMSILFTRLCSLHSMVSENTFEKLYIYITLQTWRLQCPLVCFRRVILLTSPLQALSSNPSPALHRMPHPLYRHSGDGGACVSFWSSSWQDRGNARIFRTKATTEREGYSKETGSTNC